MALLNSLMAFNLLNGSYWLYAVIAVIALILIVLIALVRVQVVYVDPDTDYEIAHKKYGWGSKITLAKASKTGKRFLGWSYDENGEKRIGKKKIRLWKTTELYAVWEKPMVGISIEDANAALEFVYVDDETGEQIVKEVCPLSISVPMEVRGESILGWGLDPSQGPLVTASETDKSVLTVELYPVREGWDEVVEEEEIEQEPEETVEEPAEEAPAEPVEEEIEQEPVEEAPVEEAPVEEVAEVVEAPVEETVEPVAEEPKEELFEEVIEEPIPEPVVIEPTIVPTYVDGHGNELNIQYSRSFTANVIQSEDNVKEFYSELKNHILSYKGVKSRISWKFDSYNRGRDQLFKLKLRGKTICMYCALNPDEFDKAKYHHEAIDAKIFADVPMLVKVKSNLGLKKAKELVDIVMAKFEIEANPKAKTVDYVAEHPYEETDALVQKGLIKILKADENDIKKAPAIVDEEPVKEEVIEPVNEEIVEETPVEEAVEEVVEEAPAEEVEEATEESAEEVAPVEEIAPVIVPTYVDGHGNELDIRYSRSVMANIIQAGDTEKSFYSEIKNYILSYKGVKSRISWKFDSFNKGRAQLFKIKLRGKTISMYCALNPDEFDKAKYHHEAVEAKMLADVPMLVKIKSNLGLKKAKELVDIVMAKFGIELDPKAKTVDYIAEHPYEETEALIQKGLVKVLQADENDVKKAPAIVDEEPVNEEIVEETPVEEEATVETVEEVAEETVEEAVEETVEEAPVEETVEDVAEEQVEEIAEEATEEPVEEAVEEVVEESPAEEVEEATEEAPVEEPVEEVVEEAVEEVVEPEAEAFEEATEEPVEEEPTPATTVEEIKYVESVSADEADELVVDEVVDSLVEEDVEYIEKDDVKKAIVNIDTLSKEYEDGDTVDLASLKAKGLIHKKSKSVKILSRGTLDKALTIKASEFSETALKMIVLTGGKAIKTVSKVK